MKLLRNNPVFKTKTHKSSSSSVFKTSKQYGIEHKGIVYYFNTMQQLKTWALTQILDQCLIPTTKEYNSWVDSLPRIKR